MVRLPGVGQALLSIVRTNPSSVIPGLTRDPAFLEKEESIGPDQVRADGL
jgi:hypothetical protein